MIQLCVLVPDTVSNWASIAEQAEKHATRATVPGLRRWRQWTKGAADYRAGRFASAVQWLRKSQDPNSLVGESKVPQVDGGHTHAVVWTGAPGSYAVHDLGTLGETADGDFLYSSARSVSEPDANGHFWVVGTAVTIHVLANDYDPDGDALSIDWFIQGAAGTVADSGNGTLTYTPTGVEPGSDSFTYTISDGNGGTASATVTVDVLAAGGERVYTSEHGPLNIGDLKTVTSTVEATFDDPVNAVNVEINFTHAAPETLVISLFSPGGGDSLTLVPSGTPGLYGVEMPAGGLQHAGTWTLQIHDPLKDRQLISGCLWSPCCSSGGFRGRQECTSKAVALPPHVGSAGAGYGVGWGWVGGAWA